MLQSDNRDSFKSRLPIGSPRLPGTSTQPTTLPLVEHTVKLQYTPLSNLDQCCASPVFSRFMGVVNRRTGSLTITRWSSNVRRSHESTSYSSLVISPRAISGHLSGSGNSSTAFLCIHQASKPAPSSKPAVSPNPVSNHVDEFKVSPFLYVGRGSVCSAVRGKPAAAKTSPMSSTAPCADRKPAHPDIRTYRRKQLRCYQNLQISLVGKITPIAASLLEKCMGNPVSPIATGTSSYIFYSICELLQVLPEDAMLHS